MSKEKKLHSRLERLMAGLGGVAHNGAPLPAPAQPPAPEPSSTPGAPIDPHGVVPGWTWETDARGYYTACSGEIAMLLGFDSAALVGQPLTHIAVPADSASRRELASALQAQRPLLNLRLEARTPDGEDRVVILNAMPLFDDADQFHGYRGVAHVVLENNGLPAMARPANQTLGVSQTPRVPTTPASQTLGVSQTPRVSTPPSSQTLGASETPRGL